MLASVDHDDAPHLQYRFGLLPKPLRALPAPSGRKMRTCSAAQTVTRSWTNRASLTSHREAMATGSCDMRVFMPTNEHGSVRALSDAQVQKFIHDGFVRVDRAFPRELADEGRAILWRDTGCDPHDPITWTRPVIRLG